MSEVVGGPTTAWDRAVAAGVAALDTPENGYLPSRGYFDADIASACLAAAVPVLLEALRGRIEAESNCGDVGIGVGLRVAADLVRGFAAEVQP